MQVNISNIRDLSDDSYSIVQRGLLLTILLLKDVDPKLTLAKFKAKVNINDFRANLIVLHERGVITWSGYNAAVKLEEKKELSPQLIEVVDFLNKTFGTKYQASSQSFINLPQRLKENSTEDVKLVIANRWKKWKDDPVMREYLTPTTLFRPSKFDKYLQEVRLTHIGESLVGAEKIALSDGDEITFEISKSLIDSEVYNVELITLNESRERVGNSSHLVKTGKDIKLSLRALQNNINHNGFKEFQYNYIAK